MEQILYVLCVTAVLWFSMPALTERGTRVKGVLLALFLPPISWAWLLWIGYHRRTRLAQAEASRTAVLLEFEERRQRREDVAFWRGLLRTGGPTEQEAARMYLESIGASPEPDASEVFAGELAACTWQELRNMEGYYLRVLGSSAATREVALSCRDKLDAVRGEISLRARRPGGVPLTRVTVDPQRVRELLPFAGMDSQQVREFMRKHIR